MKNGGFSVVRENSSSKDDADADCPSWVSPKSIYYKIGALHRCAVYETPVQRKRCRFKDSGSCKSHARHDNAIVYSARIV